MSDGVFVKNLINELANLGFEVVTLRRKEDGELIHFGDSESDLDMLPRQYKHLMEYVKEKEKNTNESLPVPTAIWHFGISKAVDKLVSRVSVDYMAYRMVGAKFIEYDDEEYGDVLVHVGAFSPDRFSMQEMENQFKQYIDRLAYLDSWKGKYTPDFD